MTLFAQFASNIESYYSPLTATIPSIFAKCTSSFNASLYTLNNRECRNYFHKKYSIRFHSKSSNQVNKGSFSLLTKEREPKEINSLISQDSKDIRYIRDLKNFREMRNSTSNNTNL